MGVIIILAMVASCIIFLSPFVIYVRKRKKEHSLTWELNNYIEYLYTLKHKYAVLIVGFLCFFIFLLGIVVMIGIGLPFLAPLSFYVAAMVFVLWRKYVIRRFYKVKNGEEYCELVKVEELSFLDKLYENSAVTYMRTPEPEFLNFLYNRLHNMGLLEGETLKIYAFSSADLKKKYGVDLIGRIDSFLCIMLKDNDAVGELVDLERINSCLLDDLVDCRDHFFDSPWDALKGVASEKSYGRW